MEDNRLSQEVKALKDELKYSNYSFGYYFRYWLAIGIINTSILLPLNSLFIFFQTILNALSLLVAAFFIIIIEGFLIYKITYWFCQKFLLNRIVLLKVCHFMGFFWAIIAVSSSLLPALPIISSDFAYAVGYLISFAYEMIIAVIIYQLPVRLNYEKYEDSWYCRKRLTKVLVLVSAILFSFILSFFIQLSALKENQYPNELGTTIDIPTSVYDDIDHINKELSGLIGPQIDSEISLHEETLLIQLSGLYRQYGEFIPELKDLYTKYKDYINSISP